MKHKCLTLVLQQKVVFKIFSKNWMTDYGLPLESKNRKQIVLYQSNVNAGDS